MQITDTRPSFTRPEVSTSLDTRTSRDQKSPAQPPPPNTDLISCDIFQYVLHFAGVSIYVFYLGKSGEM